MRYGLKFLKYNLMAYTREENYGARLPLNIVLSQLISDFLMCDVGVQRLSVSFKKLNLKKLMIITTKMHNNILLIMKCNIIQYNISI